MIVLVGDPATTPVGKTLVNVGNPGVIVSVTASDTLLFAAAVELTVTVDLYTPGASPVGSALNATIDVNAGKMIPFIGVALSHVAPEIEIVYGINAPLPDRFTLIAAGIDAPRT